MLSYAQTKYGEFSVENLTRVDLGNKSKWNSFSVTPLTDEESKEIERGILGDGTKKFFKF